MDSMDSTAAPSKVSKSTIDTAISALLKYKTASQSTTQKLQLLPEDDFIYLNLTLKKIPSNPRTNPFRIPLPHPVLDPTSQICLIIDDRSQTPTPPSDHIKKLVQSHNIPISKVLRLSKLKSNYKPFEAKRKLCESYDLFLVDKRVVHLLPKLLGKEFFRRKKLPLGVDLGKRDLKGQVERALGCCLMYLRSGTCCVMKVGRVAMEKEEVVENVCVAVDGAVGVVPKGWEGVRSLHLKFCDSVALPVYQAMPDVRLKIEGVKEREEGYGVSDSEGEVKGKKSGGRENKKKRKTKGRIHEVRYMDVGGGVETDGDDDDVELERSMNDDELVGQKGDEDETKLNEDEDFSVPETKMVKRSKKRVEKDGVSEELNGERRSKKRAKAEKSEVKKLKKNPLSAGEESSGKKGKKNAELGKRKSERIAKAKVTKLGKE